jgi:hypothetical protein
MSSTLRVGDYEFHASDVSTPAIWVTGTVGAMIGYQGGGELADYLAINSEALAIGVKLAVGLVGLTIGSMGSTIAASYLPGGFRRRISS